MVGNQHRAWQWCALALSTFTETMPLTNSGASGLASPSLTIPRNSCPFGMVLGWVGAQRRELEEEAGRM